VSLRADAPVFVPSISGGEGVDVRPIIYPSNSKVDLHITRLGQTSFSGNRRSNYEDKAQSGRNNVNQTQSTHEKGRNSRHARSSRRVELNSKFEDRCNNSRRRRRNKAHDKIALRQSTAPPEDHPVNNRDQSSSGVVSLSASAFPALNPLISSRIVGPTEWSRSPNITIERNRKNSNEELKVAAFHQNGQHHQQCWQEGLEKLILSTPSKSTHQGVIVRKQILRRQESEDLKDKKNIDGEDGLVSLYCNEGEVKRSSQDDAGHAPRIEAVSRRPRINMDKLRDRWWDALAQKQLIVQFREELANVLERRRVDPLVFDDKWIERDQILCDNVEKPYIADANDHEKQAEEPLQLSSLLEHFLRASSGTIGGKNDDHNLQQLLSLSSKLNASNNSLCYQNTETFENVAWSLIEAAVNYNQPEILRRVLSKVDGTPPQVSIARRNPLMRAVELGHEECTSILLSNPGKRGNDLFRKDECGNNVLHYCCRGSGNQSILKLLLGNVLGSNKRKQQQLSKLLVATNDRLCTPFHEACRCKRVDFVEVLLNACNSSILCKILSTEDSDNQTPLLTAVASNACDVVLSLIMWRGNHALRSKRPPNYLCPEKLVKKDSIAKLNNLSQSACPLVWAARLGKLDMIDLLLQFGDQVRSYHVTDALNELVRSDAPDGVKLEGIELLIHANADPFKETSSATSGTFETCVSLATCSGSLSIVQRVVSSGKRALRNRQLSRRRDPNLQLQPESYFRTIESRENSEMKMAVNAALLQSLLLAYLDKAPINFAIADVLYENDGELDKDDLSRLRVAMKTRKLVLEPPLSSNLYVMAVYDYALVPNVAVGGTSMPKDLNYDRSHLAYNTLFLFNMPWLKTNTTVMCPWISGNTPCTRSLSLRREDEMVLTTNDGGRFKVHELIITQKSAKLDSAIRFGRMNSGERAADGVFELFVPIQTPFLQAMIQNFYHGSIFCWPTLTKDELCRFLLELMLVAEEFLCHDLMKEIEMRLLSSEPQKCFCWSCCDSVRIHPSHHPDSRMVQCMYCVNGISSLLTESRILDVLGLTECIGIPQYKLHLKPMGPNTRIEISSGQWTGWFDAEALSILKDSMTLAILCNFAKVRNGIADSIDVSMEGMDIESHKLVFLQLCLDNLLDNSLLIPFSERAFSKIQSRME
jgi:ankyrin repeat protein